MFKIKLRDSETLQVTCSKPAKRQVLLAELQVHIPIPENHCLLLEYCENTSPAISQKHSKKMKKMKRKMKML